MRTILATLCSLVSLACSAQIPQEVMQWTLAKATNVVSSSFSPSDVSGLVMWYDSDSIGAPTNTSGYSVTNWYDRSASGFTATQVADTKQPYYTNNAGQINNKAWLKFDGANDFLAHGGGNFAQPNTLFIVGFFTKLPTAAASMFDGTNTSTAQSFQLTSAAKLALNSGGTARLTAADSFTNKFMLFELTYNGTSSTIATNGTVMGDNAADPSTQPLTGLFIGQRAAGSRFLEGGIAEILFYNANVASGDRTSIRNYLTNKYGTYDNW